MGPKLIVPEIIIKYDYHVFSVEFLTGHPLKRYWNAKYWPRVTQCVIKKDGLIIGIGEVVKHDRDIDNPRHGRLFAAKKAFKEANIKCWWLPKLELFTEVLTQA